MTTSFEKSFDVQAPIQQVFEQWVDFTSYPKFMPHVQQVRSIEEGQWVWETVDQRWQVKITQKTPATLFGWRIAAPDYTCDAALRFEPLDDAEGTRLVYTAHYPNGLGLHHTASSVAHDMQTALAQFAQLLGEAPSEGSQQAAATDELDADIPQIVESTETLQRTLSEATQAWTSSMVKAFGSFHALLWSPVNGLNLDLGTSVNTWVPRFNITENDGALVVCSELPGYKASDLHVEILDGHLVVKGERHLTQVPASTSSEGPQAQTPDAVTHELERFCERLPLEQVVDASHVEAQVTPSGQLRIVLPLKREEFAPASA